MKAAVIFDKDYETDQFLKLKDHIGAALDSRGFETEFFGIGRGDLAFCMGCFGCWVKKPGECVINDGMAEINRAYVGSDVFIYLSPVVFGQYSANIKCALDRWLPNALPFFETRPDGSTIHPARYEKLPKTIVIGYGKDLAEEDAALFNDITMKHRRGVDVIIYQGRDEEFVRAFESVKFGKAGPEL